MDPDPAGEGLEVTQRLVTREEEGRTPEELGEEKVLAVIRNRTLRRALDAAFTPPTAVEEGSR